MSAPAGRQAPAAPAPEGTPAAGIMAVVVNYNAGNLLSECIRSLNDEGVGHVVVVDNDSTDGSMKAMAEAHPGSGTLSATRNLGYGAAANLGARGVQDRYLLICNPDLWAHGGAVASLVRVLDDNPEAAIAGPLLRESSGEVYPSGRDFPTLAEAVGHGFLGLVWGGNPWTRRYRRLGAEQHRPRSADWVSGAFFLVRREAFEEVGGFDERYFMYVEDVDLCWRVRKAGWDIRYEPSAEVTHEQGRSTARHPYRMLAAHHSSMWRFARTTSRGRERALLPLVGAGLAIRLLLSWLEHLIDLRSKLARRHG